MSFLSFLKELIFEEDYYKNTSPTHISISLAIGDKFQSYPPKDNSTRKWIRPQSPPPDLRMYLTTRFSNGMLPKAKRPLSDEIDEKFKIQFDDIGELDMCRCQYLLCSCECDIHKNK